MDPKSVQNRCKIDLGRFWALGAVSETRRDALRTALGRQKAVAGPILGRPGRAKSAREASKSLSGPVPRRPRTTPEQCLSAFGAPSAVEHARGTIFHRFCVVARKLRCAFRISFSGVLLTSDEVSTARARTAKTLENRSVSASKIEPGSVRATHNGVRAAPFERKGALEVPPGPPKIYKRARTSNFERERATASGQDERDARGIQGDSE